MQCGGSDGSTLRDQELGSDGGDAEDAGGVPPWSGLEDSGDVSLDIQGWGMGVVICGGGLGGDGDVANEGVHSEAAGYHCGIYRELPHL